MNNLQHKQQLEEAKQLDDIHLKQEITTTVEDEEVVLLAGKHKSVKFIAVLSILLLLAIGIWLCQHQVQTQIIEEITLQARIEVENNDIQVGENSLLNVQITSKHTESDIVEKEYFSLDETVVTVSQKGVVTATGEGTGTVGVILKTNNQKIIREASVTVNPRIVEKEVLDEGKNIVEVDAEKIQEVTGVDAEKVQEMTGVDAEKIQEVTGVDAEKVQEMTGVDAEKGQEASGVDEEKLYNEEKQELIVEDSIPTEKKEMQETQEQLQYIGYSEVMYDNKISKLGFTIKRISEKESGDMIEFLVEYEQDHNVVMSVDCYKRVINYGNTLEYIVNDKCLYVEDGKTYTIFNIPKKALQELHFIGIFFAKGEVTEGISIPEHEIERICNKYKISSSDGVESAQVTFIQEKNELQDIIIHEIKSKDFGEMVEICLKLTTSGWTKVNIINDNVVANKVVENGLSEEWISLYVNKKALKNSRGAMISINGEEYELGRNIYFIDMLYK